MMISSSTEADGNNQTLRHSLRVMIRSIAINCRPVRRENRIS
jgi:hypothetical protein